MQSLWSLGGEAQGQEPEMPARTATGTPDNNQGHRNTFKSRFQQRVPWWWKKDYAMAGGAIAKYASGSESAAHFDPEWYLFWYFVTTTIATVETQNMDPINH